MKPLSKDIRSRLVAAKEAGEGSVRVLAERFKVGSATVQRLFTKLKETKSIEPLPHGGGMPAKIPDSELSKVIELVKEKPDRTIEELINEWRIRYVINVSSSAMSRTLERCNLSLKKKLLQPQSVIQKKI